MRRALLVPRLTWGGATQCARDGEWEGWYLRLEWLGCALELQGTRFEDRGRA